MKVLSLFDGMSCGRIALDQLGIPVEKYYASEIDKHAIKVSQANYPDIIQIGDVTKVNPKNYMDVDLILSGSPCTGFSFAGKQLAFEDPQSKLFFDFIRILKAIKPKYFLLENVRMKKEFLQVISEQVSACYPEITFGIEPIFINSSLVSAQSRQRYYWTNIPNIKQPEDRGIVLRDILETECDQSGKPTNKPIKVGMNVEEVRVRKHEVDIPGLQTCILDHYSKCGKNKKEIAKELNDKYSTVEHYFRKLGSDFFSIPSEEHWPQLKEILGITTDKFDKQIMEFEYRDGVFESTQRVYSDQGKSPTLTATNKEQMIETRPKQVGVAVDIKGHDQIKRVYSPEGKSPTVTTCGGGHREPKVVTGGAFRGRAYDKDGKRMDKDGVSVANKTKQMLELRKDHKSNAITTVGKDSVVANEDLTWRKLTPLECERLQTVPDNYTNHVSNTQRYKMLGNGWTIEVIKHIFKNMEI